MGYRVLGMGYRVWSWGEGCRVRGEGSERGRVTRWHTLRESTCTTHSHGACIWWATTHIPVCARRGEASKFSASAASAASSLHECVQPWASGAKKSFPSSQQYLPLKYVVTGEEEDELRIRQDGSAIGGDPEAIRRRF